MLNRTQWMWTRYWLVERRSPLTFARLVLFTLLHVRLLQFMIVGTSGIVVGLNSLWLLTDVAGLHYLGSYAIAFVLSASWNYYWHDHWTFRGSTERSFLVKYAGFILLYTVTLAVSEVLMFALTDIWHVWYMFSAVLVLFAVVPIRYIVSKKWIWRYD